ncbi:complex I NDUFA9 subunit family protein [Haloarchaeobius iranensis]|uniref:NADH dehydrogenase n=1 Tax=Haloarchaeobius iranensis TaxID=996166 RepID=A0A1G9YC85_9EURY|nr:complex I NDUFA9 subunit family protein [Haloarchaeobius iranensis]SDN06145.1 NADH dehydrogenase [Haloarchaeobius iranensis]
MNVIVAGGTGFIGSHLCAELADRGHDVTALARSPDDADLPNTVETAMGDVSAYESIESHFEGQDVAVNLVALSPLFKPKGNLSHETVHLQGTENVVRACEEHDVGKLVQMSALGADPNGPTAYLRTKGQAEEVVRSADLDWVLVRPSVVFGDGGEFVSFTKKLTTPYVTGFPGGGKTPFQPIWLGDLVPMLADAVEDDDHVGEAYDIGGPEVLTLADVTHLAYAAEGKSVRILPVPMPLAKLGMTMAGPLPFIPFGPDQARSLKVDNTVADNGVAAFGVEPHELTTLSSYLGVENTAKASA